MNTYYQTSTLKNDNTLEYNEQEIKVTQYEKVSNSAVQKIVSIGDILNTIKNGDEHLTLIQKARQIGKGNKGYDYIKTNQLPTFRFNFLFKDSASNKNVTVPTGLIYIDYDNVENIPESEFIFAKWKSLSNKGFGILVKIDNLTKTNFKDAYSNISKIIYSKVESDSGARKLTQQTVLSFDSKLYWNSNSVTYHYAESKKVSLVNIIEREKGGIVINETFSENPNYSAINYSNISEYFVGEFSTIPYLVFTEEKTKICQPFIPNTIKEGTRNSTMFSVLSNISLLNPNCGKGLLKMFSNHLNGKMYPQLPDFEINSIIENVLRRRENGELEMYLNKERRILFNPNIDLTRQEKSLIIGREIGNIKKNKTKQKIYEVVGNWDFRNNGKIIQKKVSILTNISISTIKKYWPEFKDYIQQINLY